MAETKRTILLEYEIETGKLLDANGKVIKSIKQLKEEVEATAAANQKMGDSVGKNSEIVLGSISHIKNQVAALKQQRDNTAVGSREFQNLNAKLTETQARLKAATTATVQQANAQEEVGQTTKELAKLQEYQARSAGLAGAAAFELGRTISDLPFGLVAISNNVSQLGTLFAALVANAGGVSKALGFIKQQLTGPAGILIAFQVVVAAITFFTRQIEKADKSVNALADAEAGAATNLKALRDALELQTVSLTQAEKMVSQANKEYEGLNLRVKDNLQLTSESKIALDNLILSFEKAAKAKAALTLVEQLYQEQIEKEIFLEKLRTDGFEGFTAVYQGFLTGLAGGIVMPELGKQLRIDAAEASLRGVSDRIKEVLTTVGSEGLADKIFGPEKQGEKSKAERTFFPFLSDEQLKYLEKNIEGTTSFIKNQISALERQRDQFATTSDQFDRYNSKIVELEKALARISDPNAYAQVNKIAEFQVGALQTNVTEVIRKTIENTKVWGDIRKLNITQLAETLDPEKMTEDLMAHQNFKGNMLDLDKLFKLSEQAEKMAEKAELVNNIASSFNDILSAQADREIAIERNKTTAINDELKMRLANEQLTAEQRDRINQQISRNEAALVEKQNEIAKKQFQREKALKIVMALADTFSSASKAYLSQFLPIPTPDSPVRGAIAAKIAAGFGLAQVAALSRLKYTQQALPSPNLVAQGTSQVSQAPSFNVVGASTQNQLAAVIAGQNERPIRTYVVSSDVSSAQELDRRIVEGASI